MLRIIHHNKLETCKISERPKEYQAFLRVKESSYHQDIQI